MKIERGTVTIIRITEVYGLDPIRVTLDDIAPGKGRINIECWGEAWASYWGGMGAKTIARFFAGCDNEYLIGNLAPQLEREVASGEQFAKRCQQRICKMRREHDLTAERAREFFDEAEEMNWCASIDAIHNTARQAFLHTIYGDEWWYGVDDDCKAENPKRVYLSRIINTVREALLRMDLPAYAQAVPA